MKIHISSDWHLGRAGDCYPAPVTTGADLILLGGDQGTDGKGTGELIEWCRRLNPNAPILVILGNHDFWSPQRTHDEIRKAANEDMVGLLNARLLENESAEFTFGGEAVRILGCTLWTDFRGGEPLEMVKCRQAVNDHRFIRMDGRGLLPEDSLAWHRKSLAWLKEELRGPFAGKTVVLTHHAPSFRSQAAKWQGSTCGGAFCSDLEAFIEKFQPDLWCHGHLHDSADYQIGRTRIICNPYGYNGREVNPGFRPDFLVEI